MTRLTRRLSAVAATVALAATGIACGGDDSGGGSGAQSQLAAQLIAEAREDGLDVDESCIRQVTSRISESDARAWIDDNEDEMSQEGAVAMMGLFECVDLSDLFGDLDLDDLDLEGLFDD